MVRSTEANYNSRYCYAAIRDSVKILHKDDHRPSRANITTSEEFVASYSKSAIDEVTVGMFREEHASQLLVTTIIGQVPAKSCEGIQRCSDNGISDSHGDLVSNDSDLNQNSLFHESGIVDTTDTITASNRWAMSLFSSHSESMKLDLRSLIEEAARHAGMEHGEAAARGWANGYTLPQRYIDSDIKCLRAASLDFVKMVRRRQTTLSPERLNPGRIGRLREDNPERHLLLDLAIGMKVHLPEGFVPNGRTAPSPLRKTYIAVSTAVNKMLSDLVEQRLSFLIPYSVAKEHIPNLHLAKAHWTRKKGKPSGRPLGDMTFVDGTPLNTVETAAAAAAYYGEIQHPTIEKIASMVWAFWQERVSANPGARWSDVRIWKMDLRGAYTLLSFRPEDVGLFGMMLTNDTVYLQTAGIFGWSGTPAAFQVITRAIKWELQHRLLSDVCMYVDDVIGVGMIDEIPHDLALTRHVCVDLLGPTAVADDKTEVGRRVDVIGYTVDLDTMRVSIAQKNFLNTFHGFISANIHQTITLRTAQRLASWASRYGKICRVMRPFCGALNRLMAGRTNPHAVFPLSDEAIMAVKCWCAMLCLVRQRETDFTRSLQSFAPFHPRIIGEFDASLAGVGVVWYYRDLDAEVVLGVCAIDISFLGFKEDSSFQNLAEFIGAITVIIGGIMIGCRGQSMDLRGDSVTALTWAVTERARGNLATNAAMIWTSLCIAADVNVQEGIHIPGVDNDRCDQLSRRGPDCPQSVEDHAAAMGIIGALDVQVQQDASAKTLLELCCPKVERNTDERFAVFWERANAAIASLLERFPSRPDRLPSYSTPSLITHPDV